MRRIIVTIAFILSATAVFAADTPNRQTQLSLFTSNESDTSASVGLAFARDLTPRWSAELKIADQRHSAGVVTFVGSPAIAVTERVPFSTHPIDVLAHYRFTNGSRWTPYLSAGVRYVKAPDIHSMVVSDVQPGAPDARAVQLFGNRYDAQVGVGTTFRITQHFALRLDANALLRNSDVFYDPLFRPSAGLSWRF
ncbi:MAG TPA: hypothetical protein VF980_02760 [Thermoanaerobaculia bacterium]